MNIINSVLKCIVSRAEIILYLQSVNVSQFQFEEILSTVNFMELRTSKLEDQNHKTLSTIIHDERYQSYIKMTLIKVINILNSYLNQRGCKLDEDKKLQKSMFSMSIQNILLQYSQQSSSALQESLSTLKSKKQSINNKTIVFQYTKNTILLDLTRLQREFLLISNPLCQNSFFSTHLLQYLQIEYIEQLNIYSWIIKTFRVCQTHIDENNMKLDIQDVRFFLVTDFIAKRFDILYKDLYERNLCIQNEIQNYVNNKSSNRLNTALNLQRPILTSLSPSPAPLTQKQMMNPQQYSTPVYFQNSSNKVIKFVSDTQRYNQFFDPSQTKKSLTKTFYNIKMLNLDVSPFSPAINNFSKQYKQYSKQSNASGFGLVQTSNSIESKYYNSSFIELPAKKTIVRINKPFLTDMQKKQQIIPRSASNFTMAQTNNRYLYQQSNIKISEPNYSKPKKDLSDKLVMFISNPCSIQKSKEEQSVIRSLNLLKFNLYQHSRRDQQK